MATSTTSTSRTASSSRIEDKYSHAATDTEAPKLPTATSIYGFLLMVFSIMLAIIYAAYIIAAVVADPSSSSSSSSSPSASSDGLLALLPDVYWLLAIPSYLTVLPIFYIVIYFAANLLYLQPPNSNQVFEDGFTRHEDSETRAKHMAYYDPCYSIPHVFDMTMKDVHQKLYHVKVS